MTQTTASPKPYGKVYKVINLVNDAVYIGQTTKTVIDRWKAHKAIASRSDYPLYRAMRKYGVDSFLVCKVGSANTQEELDALEMKLIAEARAKGKCYNISNGGYGHGKMSEDTKRKISMKRKGQKLGPVSEEARLNMCKAQREIFSVQQDLNRHRMKPIHCQTLDIYFDGIREAERQTGISRRKILWVLQGASSHVDGMSFKYVRKEDQPEEKPIVFRIPRRHRRVEPKPPRQKKAKPPKKVREYKGKPVHCQTLDIYFRSISEASRATGCKERRLLNVCHGKQLATNGLVFRFVGLNA